MKTTFMFMDVDIFTVVCSAICVALQQMCITPIKCGADTRLQWR